MVEADVREGGATCWMDVADEDGVLRERRYGGTMRWEYAYDCDGPEWQLAE